MLTNIPEHPDIARTLATGYPRPSVRPPAHCCDCGKELWGDDSVFDWDGDQLCETCVKDRIEENFDIRAVADALGIVCKAAYLLEEELKND